MYKILVARPSIHVPNGVGQTKREEGSHDLKSEKEPRYKVLS